MNTATFTFKTSIPVVHFEALEQTLRLRLVSGPADKKFFLIIGSAPAPTVSL
jgi:hypothetical protein